MQAMIEAAAKALRIEASAAVIDKALALLNRAGIEEISAAQWQAWIRHAHGIDRAGCCIAQAVLEA